MSIRRLLLLVLLMTATGCAARAPVSHAKAPPSFDDTVDALIRRGCYACLEQAYGTAESQGIRLQAFEAATLLTLRSKELGLPSEGWIERARTLAGSGFDQTRHAVPFPSRSVGLIAARSSTCGKTLSICGALQLLPDWLK